MKKFIKIVSNCYFNYEDSGETFPYDEQMESYELIPADNLVKIYRYFPAKEHVLVYVFICPETGMKRMFYERFRTKQIMLDRLDEIEKMLA